MIAGAGHPYRKRVGGQPYLCKLGGIAPRIGCFRAAGHCGLYGWPIWRRHATVRILFMRYTDFIPCSKPPDPRPRGQLRRDGSIGFAILGDNCTRSGSGIGS